VIVFIIKINIVIMLIIIVMIIINSFSFHTGLKASTKFHHAPLFKAWVKLGRRQKTASNMNIRKIVCCGIVSQDHVHSQGFVVWVFSLWVLIQ
jgi:hypothetical protein